MPRDGEDAAGHQVEEANYATIAELQVHNWWYAARRDLLDRAVGGVPSPDHGLDIGCGAGANLAVLRRHCRRATGIDLSGWAVQWCRRHGFAEVLEADLQRLPFADSSFDLVTCMDVLEHVDDVAAVAEVQRVLRPGGWLMVSVPAHRYLWNDNDDLSHHRRRYGRAQLARLLAGWEVGELAFWCFLPFLPTLAYSLWCRASGPRLAKNNLDRVPAFAAPLLRATALAENRLRWLVTPPTGTSLFAVARRPLALSVAPGGG